MKIVIGVVFFGQLYCSEFVVAQCPGYSNARNPGASTNIIVAGSTPWEVTYPSTQTSNNVYTNMRMGTVFTSHYLSVYDWGYGYSTGTICGIKVRVEKAAPATNPGTVTDLEAKLFNGASYSPNNYAKAGAWPTTDTYFTYGGNADLWGFASITAAQLNSVNFAFRFRAQRTDLNDSAKIDHVEVTGYSDELLPVELLSFDAIKNVKERSVHFTWKCAMELNNDFFTLKRSKDNVNWENVSDVKGAGTTSQVTEYEFTDTEPYPGTSYYRLCQTDYDGTTKYLDRISVRFKNDLDEVAVYPSMAHDEIYVKAMSDINNSTLEIMDISGRVLQEVVVKENNTTYESFMDVSRLVPGVYILRFTNGDFSTCTKFVKL